eukprot:2245327-Amphidinium_carterae.1
MRRRNALRGRQVFEHPWDPWCRPSVSSVRSKQVNNIGAADRSKGVRHIELKERKVRVTSPTSIHISGKLRTTVTEVPKLHIGHRRLH